MTIEDQIKDEKLQNDIDREAAEISTLSSLLVKKYCHRINDKLLNKLNLLILLWEKLLKNRQKQLKIKEKNK